MSETLYPWGYQKSLVTLENLKRLAKFNQMDQGYGRRLEAWLVSRGGEIGIGGALRTQQPNKPGFAPTGQTFHMLVQFSDGGFAFMAVDLVCRNGDNVHRSPRWDEVPRQGSSHPDIGTYGVHCNVNGEPWHMQAIEVDGFMTWANRGRLRPNPNFSLPEAPTEPLPQPEPEPTPEPPVPQPEPPTPQPPTNPGAITVEFTSRYLWEGAEGKDVAWLQNNLNRITGAGLTADGSFGQQTKAAVINYQRFFGLTADGEVGPATQRSIVEVSLAVGK